MASWRKYHNIGRRALPYAPLGTVVPKRRPPQSRYNEPQLPSRTVLLIVGHSFVSRAAQFVRRMSEPLPGISEDTQFQGFPGANARGLLGRVEAMGKPIPPFVVLHIGDNDLDTAPSYGEVDRTPAQIVEDVLAIVSYLLGNGARRVVLLKAHPRRPPPPRNPAVLINPTGIETPYLRRPDYDARRRDFNCLLRDRTREPRFQGRALLWERTAFRGYGPDTVLARDGVHLSDRKQREYCKILDQVGRYLRRNFPAEAISV